MCRAQVNRYLEHNTTDRFNVIEYKLLLQNGECVQIIVNERTGTETFVSGSAGEHTKSSYTD